MTIAALGATLPPATTGAQPPAHPGDDGGAFARQLELAAQPETAADASPAPREAQNTQNQQRAKARASGDRPPAERSAKPASPADAAGAPAGGGTDKPAAADADAPPADLSALMASLLAHASPQANAARADARAGTAAAQAAVAADADGRRAGGAAGAGVADGAAERAPLMRARADAEATLPEARTDAAAFALPAQAQPLPAAPADSASRAAAPAYQAQVDAALGTPDFAPGLSAQVSVMLREGVQEARLQLNPAEMGPITVQIQIDGSNAQVNMSAEQAPTRQALEEALPSLAGALQENGLTLTGGGVFEQPRQPRDETDEPGRTQRLGAGPAAAGEAVAAAPAPRRSAARGVVDLYA